MQQDKSFAISCGWKDEGEQIIMDTRDLGLSGQLRMEDRPAFRDMLRRIENRMIGAIVTCNVDRLFRNKWGDESGKFMEICHRYNVLVITPDFVYDFRISWHIERFRRRCEEAWNYLEYHVYGRMLKAQEMRGVGGYWTGGSIPLGYIVDRQETLDGRKNLNYNKYIPYPPHAEGIRWIFRRFKEHNGCVAALLREIETRDCLFPDFDDSIDKAVLSVFWHCTAVPGGYTIASETGLRSLLTNVAYIRILGLQQRPHKHAKSRAYCRFQHFLFCLQLSLFDKIGWHTKRRRDREKTAKIHKKAPSKQACLT